MSGNFSIVQRGLVVAICMALALFLGYLLATPANFTSIAFVALVFGGLAIPLWLRWHQLFLIFSWNAALVAFFLPGQPKFGLVMAFASLFLALVMKAMHRGGRSLYVRQIAWPLLFMGLVVLITAQFTGGIGGQALGGESWGAKRYLGVFAGVVGYFALTAYAIPPKKALFYSSLFFLSGTTAFISDLIFAAGPRFYFLFNFFPADLASSQFSSQDTLMRLQGVAVAAMSVCYYMLMRYGIAGTFDLRKPWRAVCFITLVAASLFGGFRSALVLLGLIFAAQCYFEGIFKTRLFAGLVATAILVGSITMVFANKLPLSVQRSISFLPVNVDPAAKMDAQGTIDWRLEMWQVLLPDIPKYFWFGKGFSFSGTDYYLTQQAQARGAYAAYESTLISGNYHHGLLTLIIPFGIWGLLGFLWFSVASLKVLYANYRFSSPALKHINIFLISFFVARLFYYVFLYGQYDLDLIIFVGIVGFSIALNGGVRSRKSLMVEEAKQPVAPLAQTAPAT